jgi:chromosome segregation ATPase
MEAMYNYKANKENKLILSELDNKIIILEDKIKLLFNFIPSFPEDKTKTLNDILDEYQININNNNFDIREIKDKINRMKNALDEMAIKVNDFNVYDLFKDISDSGGDVEASKILIQALDKKMQERFKFQDEKIKNDEQETLKVKTEVTNLKNTTSFDKRNLTTIKEQIIKLQNEVDSNKKNLSEKVSKNQNEIDSVREKELQSLENLNNEIKDLMNRINNLSNKVDLINEEREIEKELRKKELDEESIQTKKFDDSNYIKVDRFIEFKDSMLKKINSLDKKYQSLNSEIKNDFYEQEINALKLEINNKKPTQQEFYNLSIQVQQFTELFETMKEENINLQSDMKKTRDTISALTKKYENVILQAMNINKANSESEENKNFEKNNILTKFDDYVEISIFNEFIKEQTKFSEKLKKDFEKYRNFYDEIIETLKKAASVQDLKNLEEYFVDLLEEIKDKTSKLYPKKSDVNKSFKSVELQIKQIYEFLNKRDEQGDNWMLAKKPLGGYSCASCETYLGDLRENNEKIFWNQLPDREPSINTNSNKIGNGFSRILNLVNISKEMKKENLFNNSITKPDYGAYKIEIGQKKANEANGSGGVEMSSIEPKHYMNITLTNNKEDKKSNNTNYSSIPKKSFVQEDMKFGLTVSENLNLFKQLKSKKFNKSLPPISINKEDSNIRDANLSAGEYFEELNINEIREKKDAPKIMKIIKKKNK